MFGSKNLPGMKHLIELHPRGLLNVAFGVGEEVSQQWRSAQFVVCLVVRLATLCQVGLQLMITLSFAALSGFRWFGHGHCGPVPFGENLTTDNNIVDRKIRLYVLSLAESSVQIIYIDAHRHH